MTCASRSRSSRLSEGFAEWWCPRWPSRDCEPRWLEVGGLAQPKSKSGELCRRVARTSSRSIRFRLRRRCGGCCVPSLHIRWVSARARAPAVQPLVVQIPCRTKGDRTGNTTLIAHPCSKPRVCIGRCLAAIARLVGASSCSWVLGGMGLEPLAASAWEMFVEEPGSGRSRSGAKVSLWICCTYRPKGRGRPERRSRCRSKLCPKWARKARIGPHFVMSIWRWLCVGGRELIGRLGLLMLTHHARRCRHGGPKIKKCRRACPGVNFETWRRRRHRSLGNLIWQLGQRLPRGGSA